jgi:hypothetical protein
VARHKKAPPSASQDRGWNQKRRQGRSGVCSPGITGGEWMNTMRWLTAAAVTYIVAANFRENQTESRRKPHYGRLMPLQRIHDMPQRNSI